VIFPDIPSWNGMWAWLADRLILCPSRHRIPCESERRWIDWEGGRFETWVQRTIVGREIELLVLKFSGTGGRAERSTNHPADCWSDLATEVWTVNPPGYGGSPGRASLAYTTAIAEAAWKAVDEVADGRPVLVTGNSLGSLPALYLAAHSPVAGLLLRNPVPLREVILARYGRLASMIARQVPSQLCPIRNAAQADAPAVIVTSGKDRMVPPSLQQKVISKYAGAAQVLRLVDADHADPPSDDELQEYVKLLNWLRKRVVENSAHNRR
jgi:pimeloyl-ACP methyl ester carboxylesterase